MPTRKKNTRTNAPAEPDAGKASAAAPAENTVENSAQPAATQSQPAAASDSTPAQSHESNIGTDAVEQPKRWAHKYKGIRKTRTFELLEDGPFKQRVFKFNERPSDDRIAALKESGFTYRPNEKAWTTPAAGGGRAISDELAKRFAEEEIGQGDGPSR